MESVSTKDWETIVDAIALYNDIPQETSGVGINGESLDLEGELDSEMKDRKNKVGSRESRESNPVPLNTIELISPHVQAERSFELTTSLAVAGRGT